MEDDKKGGNAVPQTEPTEPVFKTENITKTKAGSHDQASQFTHVHESKASKARKKTHAVVTQHYKFITLIGIAITLIALAAVMLVVAIPQWTMPKAEDTDTNQQDTTANTQVEISNPELDVSQVETDCLSKPATGEDYTPTFITCVEEYINATSDNQRKAALYTLRVNFLVSNKMGTTDAYNEQILADLLKADEFNPTVSSANIIANFARMTSNTELYEQWNATAQERQDQQNEINGNEHDGYM